MNIAFLDAVGWDYDVSTPYQRPLGGSQSALAYLTVELARRALEYSSRRGEHVLDLFGGSGSTLVAAELTGRKAFLMELDPLYCDVIVRRWEQYTGKKAGRPGTSAS